MRLLAAANVNPSDSWSGRWLAGYNGVARECAVHVEVEDPCPPDAMFPAVGSVQIVGTVTSSKANYFVRPFPIRSFLRQSVSCEQPDDKDWFRRAVATKADYVISRGLVTQFAADQETWIKNAGAQSVVLGVTPTTEVRIAAIAAARDLWFSSVVSVNENPIMHVPPRQAPELVAGGLLSIDGEDVRSVWGDKVVISAGYDIAAPYVFFTGEIIVRMTGVDDEGGPLYDRRINDYNMSANQWGAIDLAPCAIVRVGV